MPVTNFYEICNTCTSTHVTLVPQADILANQLWTQSAKYGYYKGSNMPDTWKIHTQPIQFMLVADDFGIKYVNKRDTEHLINDLNKTITKWNLIWLTDCIVQSHLTESTKTDKLTPLCQYTLKTNKNLNTFKNDHIKIAVIQHSHKSVEKLPNIKFQKTLPRN